MILCRPCGNQNLDKSLFCDQCGARLVRGAPPPAENALESRVSGSRKVSVTSLGIAPLVADEPEQTEGDAGSEARSLRSHATLTIERGDSAATVFALSADESNIGRWDADNGIFPDVDLDPYDSDAKVSRKHARISRRDNIYTIEDLGSTNGTFINRGRRLMPGSPQILTEGDEIIVGKTFLRFHIND